MSESTKEGRPKSTMFNTTVSPATMTAEHQHQQEAAARAQFQKEVDDFRGVVFGAKEPVPPSERDVGPEMAKFAQDWQGAMDSMIVHMVTIMRGLALQNQTVGGNAVKAAGLANAAWDCSQKHLEMWAVQQLTLHKCLHNLRETFGCVLSGEELTKEVMFEHVDIEGAAMENASAIEQAMEEATARLVARAQAEALAEGKTVRTATTFADDVTARTVGQHGGAIAQNVMGQDYQGARPEPGEPMIQVASASTPLPKWSRRTKGRRN